MEALLAFQACGRLGEVDLDVGGDGAGAAFAAEAFDALAHGLDVGVMGGGDPAVELLGGAGNPDAAGPAADQDRRALLHLRPGLQVGAVHRLAGPQPPHQRQRRAQLLEPAVVILADGGEIGFGGAGADAEDQAVAGHHHHRHHAVRQFHRMAQRHLIDAGAELDFLGHGGGDRHRDQRIRQGPGAADGIEEPQPVEADPLRLPRALDQSAAAVGERAVGKRETDAKFHRRYSLLASARPRRRRRLSSEPRSRSPGSARRRWSPLPCARSSRRPPGPPRRRRAG